MSRFSVSTGIVAAVTVVALAGCGGGSTSSAKAVATTAGAAAASGAGASVTTVHATGGGAFCTEIANSINNGVSKAVAAAGTGNAAATLKADFAQSKQQEQKALADSPSAIRGDLQTIFDATNKVYDALAAANFDFTKVDPSTFTSFNTAGVQAASTNIDNYVKQHCGIDISGGAASSSLP